MMTELTALESKIAQVVAVCTALRAENADLVRQLAVAEADRARVLRRMDDARARLEALALQLPEADDEKSDDATGASLRTHRE
ncbi:hypothetical protein [Rhodocyclus gracilis]|uniref:DUF904 domain-containing protein n=1 Tax=Rhodocyclus tenuis TaxID=1066 RepID=A0A6L5JVL8_RHOTE|nr:hypothetical protein [Rhodocyclus gracilis]MQY51417.1 hypothetical protein [Rhodocyclus gracilis]